MWLPLTENGYQSFSQACAMQQQQLRTSCCSPFEMVIIRCESDRKSVITAPLPNNRPDLTLFLIQMKWTETNTHSNENCTISHETKIFCAREWSTEIKRNVWMNAMYLSNCCLGMQVLSIEHQLQHWHFVIFYSVFWTLILHFKEAMNMFVSPASVV